MNLMIMRRWTEGRDLCEIGGTLARESTGGKSASDIGFCGCARKWKPSC